MEIKQIEEYQKRIKDAEKKISLIKLKIKLRKEEANQKKLPGKIETVLAAYGKEDWDRNVWYYDEKDFSIYQRKEFISVKVRGKEVFAARLHENGVGEIEVYIPGLLWENRIDVLLDQIPLRELKFKANQLEREMSKLKERWEME